MALREDPENDPRSGWPQLLRGPPIGSPCSEKPPASYHRLYRRARDACGAAIQQQVQSAASRLHGYPDDAFMVRAKDSAGNPVIMVISPDSVTAVTEISAPAGISPSAPEQIIWRGRERASGEFRCWDRRAAGQQKRSFREFFCRHHGFGNHLPHSGQNAAKVPGLPGSTAQRCGLRIRPQSRTGFEDRGAVWQAPRHPLKPARTRVAAPEAGGVRTDLVFHAQEDNGGTAGLVSRKLIEQRFSICASPDYIERMGQPRSLTDIRHQSALSAPGPEGHTPTRPAIVSVLPASNP